MRIGMTPGEVRPLLGPPAMWMRVPDGSHEAWCYPHSWSMTFDSRHPDVTFENGVVRSAANESNHPGS